MQSDAAKVEARMIELKKKLDEKGTEIEKWLSKNVFIPKSGKDNLKLDIMKTVKPELEQDRDVDVEKILSILPFELRNQIESRMILKKLEAVNFQILSSFFHGTVKFKCV